MFVLACFGFAYGFFGVAMVFLNELQLGLLFIVHPVENDLGSLGVPISSVCISSELILLLPSSISFILLSYFLSLGTILIISLDFPFFSLS
jgi:hypothetical protein